MKHGIFPLIILISIGCGTDTKRPNVTTLSTFKDSTSYALGADLGTNLKQQKVEIDFDFFMAGLFDGKGKEVGFFGKKQNKGVVGGLQKIVCEKKKEGGQTKFKDPEEIFYKKINEKHLFALESDAGGFSPRGFSFDCKNKDFKKIIS